MVMLRAQYNKFDLGSKLVRLVIGFHSSDNDAVAIKHLKRLESMCISFNILPNGFSQDPKVTPSRWTKTKSILYTSVMTINIIQLILLSAFDLPDEWHLLLSDFFYGHPNGRFVWIFFLNLNIWGEAMRQFWIYLIRNGRVTTLKLQHSVFSKGFKTRVLFMDRFYCKKFRFVAANLAVYWVRMLFVVTISFAPILVIIVHSVSKLPKTSEQYIYTGFWLFVNYLGIVCTITSLMLTASLLTIQLSYFYFKLAYVAQTVQDLATRRRHLNVADYLIEYKATIRKIIQYQNEIEQVNIGARNLFMLVFLGHSFTTDFGTYTAAFVHIDRGFMDFFIACVSMIGFTAIGTCIYTNGVLLTKMSSCCKNLRKATRHLQLNAKAFIKVTDLEDRLSRTDIAFTIGKILDMTPEVFVIYLIENISLIMMFKVNFK